MYSGYIIAAYAATFTLLGGLVAASFIALWRARRDWAAFETEKEK